MEKPSIKPLAPPLPTGGMAAAEQHEAKTRLYRDYVVLDPAGLIGLDRKRHAPGTPLNEVSATDSQIAMWARCKQIGLKSTTEVQPS